MRHLDDVQPIDWETYLELLERERHDDIPDSADKESEFHFVDGEVEPWQ